MYPCFLSSWRNSRYSTKRRNCRTFWSLSERQYQRTGFQIIKRQLQLSAHGACCRPGYTCSRMGRSRYWWSVPCPRPYLTFHRTPCTRLPGTGIMWPPPSERNFWSFCYRRWNSGYVLPFWLSARELFTESGRQHCPTGSGIHTIFRDSGITPIPVQRHRNISR